MGELLKTFLMHLHHRVVLNRKFKGFTISQQSDKYPGNIIKKKILESFGNVTTYNIQL